MEILLGVKGVIGVIAGKARSGVKDITPVATVHPPP